jgi:hypothetical protein
MIIIPEIEKVLILVPRTGSTALRKAVLEKYPRAMDLYRHMEADGVPAPYAHWPRLGVARDPVDRLWSLYNFINLVLTSPGKQKKHRPAHGHWLKRQVYAAQPSFSQWLRHCEEPFSTPHNLGSDVPYDPYYAVSNIMPETRKSQFHHLRPDLGTEVFFFEDDGLADIAMALDVSLPGYRHNAVECMPECPPLREDDAAHLWLHHKWEMVGYYGPYGMYSVGSPPRGRLCLLRKGV